MNKDDDLFEFDAPKTFVNLYEIANAKDDGADRFFDMVEKLESAKSEPNLGIVKISSVNGNDVLEENKENFSPDDQFDDQNINSLAHQLIRSAKKTRTSKLHNRHSITVEGIELELPRIKHHAMITRLDELESTPKLDLRTRSVVKSEYKYEHIKSGSKVFKSRSLFPGAFEPSISSNNTTNIIENKPTKSSNENKQNFNNLNINIPTSSIKVPNKTQKIKVLNSQGGVQVVENKELGHGGIKVLEKQLHTVPKPFSFESRKLCATKPQVVKSTEQPWSFKARPATVLKKKPFVPKHEKKYTEPKNIRLNTERRAQEWMVFELEIKEKFSQYEENTRMRQEEMKKKEMDLIKNMRQQTIHKPEPIKKYKPVLIRKSGRPITVPHSPRFSIRPNRNCLNSISEQV
ncbi:targeting protein for Xklp2-like isoform X3 [Rhopalosiphum maidis]|uniref:targeting protein for Xklp2-like isoform X3 n=1 Tax=Rhopalosiphum maidis TaxID=43146 RepID=UPI000EFE84DC|nr:targeting protein for Xklp2-like isoform X3 [Rhopalosiphum maidis]